MAQYSDSFGEFVRETLTAAGKSDREVARRSRGLISHYTIGQMREGLVPNAELVVAFARATGTDPNSALEAAGKNWLRFDADAWAASGRSVRCALNARHAACGVGGATAL